MMNFSQAVKVCLDHVEKTHGPLDSHTDSCPECQAVAVLKDWAQNGYQRLIPGERVSEQIVHEMQVCDQTADLASELFETKLNLNREIRLREVLEKETRNLVQQMVFLTLEYRPLHVKIHRWIRNLFKGK